MKKFFFLLIGLLFVVALIIPVPQTHLDRIFSYPNGNNILGTDDTGRDVLILTIKGFGFSCINVIFGFLIALFAGCIIGVISAISYGRWLDTSIVMISETIRSFPGILLVIFFSSLGITAWIALGSLYWIFYWRFFRIRIYQEMSRGYFRGFISLGENIPRIVLRHLIPNFSEELITLSGSVFAEMLTAECILEFLGLGPALNIPSLGSLLFMSFTYSFEKAWVWLPAAILTILIVFSFQFSSTIKRYGNIWVWLK